MTQSIKIKVPFFLDDPIVAPHPVISPMHLGILYDYIIIENGTLNYQVSNISPFSNNSFDLKKMIKIIVLNEKVSCWKKDFSLDMWGRLGTDISLYLLDRDEERHRLIPKFFMASTGAGKKAWDKFLNELSSNLDLPIEQENTS